MEPKIWCSCFELHAFSFTCDVQYVVELFRIWEPRISTMDASSSSKSLLDNHEQQYAIVSAEITSKIGRLASGTGKFILIYDLQYVWNRFIIIVLVFFLDDRKQLCSDIEKLIEDGQELVRIQRN